MKNDDDRPTDDERTREAASGKRDATRDERKPAIRPTAVHSEWIHPAHLAASLEDLEELFEPDDEPREHDYGAQPPG